MAKQNINTGSSELAGDGESLRSAFTKVNDNFTELYTLTGGSSLALTEIVQDYAAPLFTHASHTGISFTYDDVNNKLIAVVTNEIPTQTGNNEKYLTTNGSTLSWANIAKDRLSLNGKEVVLIGGTDPYVTFPAVTGGAQLVIQGAEVTAASGNLALTGQSTVTVISNAAGAGGVGAQYFQFTANGSLLFPDLTVQTTAFTGDRLFNATDKIVLNQEGTSRLSMYVNNVEKSRIQINTNDLLLDSLLGGVILSALDGVGGDWYFRTDGELHSTGGKFLSTAETNAVFGSMDSPLAGASSGTVTIKSGTGNVDGGSIYIQAGTGTTGNNGEIAIRTGTTPYEWLFDNGGNLTIPGEIYGSTVSGPGGPSGRTVNITPADDASDKKFGFRVDQFGETFTRAYLDLPEAQNNKQVAISFPHANNTTGYIFTQGANTSDDGLNNAFNIFYNAGDIKLTAMTPVTGTFNTWKFGSNGNLTFPDATVQTTAFTGNAATVDITNTNGLTTTYYPTFVENRDGTEILRADVDFTYRTDDNLLSVSNITTGILKIDDGVHEKFQTKADATGTVTHDCSSGNIFYHTSPDANWTANFTNLNLSTGYATAVTLVIVQGATGYYPNAVQIGGALQTLNWQGNTNPTASSNRTDVVTFSIINNSGTYTVLGQLTGF